MGETTGTHRGIFSMRPIAAMPLTWGPRGRTRTAKSIGRILVAVMAVTAIALANPAGTGLAQFQTSPSTDREALVALYNATDGLNWRNNTNWLSAGPTPMGEWHGVTTDSDGRVTDLYLSDNQLSGRIPAELGNLINLQELGLGGNQLSGEIPAELGNLTNLQDLFLWNNELTGSIPVELGNLTNLQRLYLSMNQLTGEIPARLGNLSNLEVLWLRDNQLTGPIPGELGGLGNLELLLLSRNQLTGEIPGELGGLGNLELLLLSRNQLTGEIPAELGSLTNLRTLSLNSNELTGSIPPELGSLTNLANLFLSGNQLAGCIPQDLRGVPGNDFSEIGLPFCDIPGDPLVARYDANRNGTVDRGEVIKAINDYLFGEVGVITRADVIRLINLYLFSPSTPTNPPGAPQGLTAMANGATAMDLSWSVPASDGGAAITGYRIEVSENGSTWNDLVANTHNAAVSYSHTGLTAGTTRHYRVSAINSGGTGPASNIATGTTAGDSASDRAVLVALYDATDGANWENNTNWLSNAPMGEWYRVTTDGHGRVTQLYLGGNQLTGEIPAELGDLTNLQGLYLSNNQLTGEIPAELGRLTNLIDLSLHVNQLTGEIPAELGAIPNLEELRLNDNQLTGEIPPELASLARLLLLKLSFNQLTGEIPPELANLSNLGWLILNENQLTGEIPPDFANLPVLMKVLSLGTNQLTGEIPAGLGRLTDLTHLNLRNNRLNGEIPAELGRLTNLTHLNLRNNQLTGEIPAELGRLTNLESLYLSSNQLVGCIPSVWRDVPRNDLAQLGIDYCTPGRTRPDLVAFVTSVGDAGILYSGDPSATISALVGNEGDGTSSSTRLRFYLSDDSSITPTDDTLVGEITVGAIGADSSQDYSIGMTAPSSAGTYYYYACVAPVSGETEIQNNCQDAGNEVLVQHPVWSSYFDCGRTFSPVPLGNNYWFEGTIHAKTSLTSVIIKTYVGSLGGGFT